MKKSLLIAGSALALLASAKAASAASFTVTTGTTNTTAQSLLNGDTGTVQSGGALSLGGSTVAVTMSGTSSLTNDGTIQQTGSGRAIDNTVANSSLTISNTGTISAVSTDAVRVNTDSAINLTNSGIISVSNGGQALDWAAITTKSNSVTNMAGGVISTVGEDTVRPGANGVVNNAGTIQATPTGTTNPTGSDGIQANLSGVQVTNTGSISGRHGITGGFAGFTITVTNNAGTIAGVNGSGVNIDDLGSTSTVTNAVGATIRGGVLATATNGDGDGVDVDGVLTLNNSGDILGYGAKGVGSDGGVNNPEGVAAGGGTIINTATGRIIGSTLSSDAPNGDPTREGHGILIDDSSGGNAVAATTVTNSGLIQGRTGYGIRFIGTQNDTITNNAGGTIQGAGTGAAIQTGGGADTLTNRGAIVGENGAAVDLEDGDDTLIIEGGAASVTGSISGGAGANTATIDPGAGQAFSYAGALSNFDTVTIKSGTVTFSGVSTYAGTTAITGGTLVLSGADRLSSAGKLSLNGGTLRLANVGVAGGQTFASISLVGISVIDLGSTTSLSFNGIDSFTLGATLSVLNYDAGVSSGYAIRFLGDLTGNATFLALKDATTINGFTPIVTFDGSYTNLFITAVPEPSTIAIGIALAGLAGLRLRRRLARR